MDRSAQRNTEETARLAFFTAQDASDTAAATAGATRNAKTAAEKKFSQATDEQKFGLKQPLLDIQAQDAIDTPAANAAWDASQVAFVAWQQAQQACNTNPGAVEDVG